jgi:redox-sensitive bicupin YhaK (pirin superfamily)
MFKGNGYFFGCSSLKQKKIIFVFMDRKKFLKRGLLGGLAAIFAAKWYNVQANTKEESTELPAMGRGVEGVFAPTNKHMVGNGFKVMNFYPGGKGFEDRMSPFFLLDFNAEVNFPPSDISQGVGVHPHRGIETVTFAYKGAIEHHDSKGNHGIIGPGDIQWMTAGGGVLHKEYHEQTFNRSGGAFEMIQLWINLPKKHKMTPAKYQSIVHQEKPKFTIPNGGGEVYVISGEFKGEKGIASTFSPIHMYDIHLNENGVLDFEVPAHYNSGILLVDGQIEVNGHLVQENHYVQLKNEPGDIVIKANKKSLMLFLSGEPLNEPYVSYGPFVMNTEEEIRQAINDYNAGKFGFLAD